MRKFYFCLIILLTACSESKTETETVISKEKMALILTDAHLLEAKVNQLYLEVDSTQALFDILNGQLLERYGVDSLEYVKSVQFYSDNPDQFHDIYEIVVDSLMIRDKSKRID